MDVDGDSSVYVSREGHVYSSLYIFVRACEDVVACIGTPRIYILFLYLANSECSFRLVRVVGFLEDPVDAHICIIEALAIHQGDFQCCM